MTKKKFLIYGLDGTKTLQTKQEASFLKVGGYLRNLMIFNRHHFECAEIF